jgi:hypothetical protein
MRMQPVTLSDLQDIDDVSYAQDIVLHNESMHVLSHSINDLLDKDSLDQDSLGLDLTYLLLGCVISCMMTHVMP